MFSSSFRNSLVPGNPGYNGVNEIKVIRTSIMKKLVIEKSQKVQMGKVLVFIILMPENSSHRCLKVFI